MNIMNNVSYWITGIRRKDGAEAGATGTDFKSVPRGSEGEIPGPDRGNAAEGVNEYNE